MEGVDGEDVVEGDIICRLLFVCWTSVRRLPTSVWNIKQNFLWKVTFGLSGDSESFDLEFYW